MTVAGFPERARSYAKKSNRAAWQNDKSYIGSYHALYDSSGVDGTSYEKAERQALAAHGEITFSVYYDA